MKTSHPNLRYAKAGERRYCVYWCDEFMGIVQRTQESLYRGGSPKWEIYGVAPGVYGNRAEAAYYCIKNELVRQGRMK